MSAARPVFLGSVLPYGAVAWYDVEDVAPWLYCVVAGLVAMVALLRLDAR